MAGTTELGREAFARQAWAEAYTHLAAAGPRDPDDLERLAVAAYLVGRDEESARAWESAHRAYVASGDGEGAGRCAFWLALGLMLRGDTAHARGWVSRAERLVEDHGVAGALLRVPAIFEALEEGDAERAYELSGELVTLAERLDDPDLLALALLAHGQAVVERGELAQGLTLLDEVMVAVTTGEVSPVPAGLVYCAVIQACMDAYDLRRAAEWTEALHEWCSAQPDLVPYRGQCLVHRSQVLQAHGAWGEAVAQAEEAHHRLADAGHPAVGMALYQQGELYRLRGDHAAAECAYRAAGRHGLDPAPGFALLRLAEGRVEAATAAVRRMVDESRGRPTHALMLSAEVEVRLAADDLPRARAACDELRACASALDTPLLDAAARHAEGTVLLGEGDPGAALTALRGACRGWRALGMPYETARAQAEIGRACRALGDHDAADLEVEAARAAFEALGAAPDAARLAGGAAQARRADLTDRECQVLRLVAAGKTNRELAADLVISEHTVARHLQNIFGKLGLSSRAAATAYAFRHGLVRGED